MTEQLLAWYGSQPLKGEVMDRLRKHREQDDFFQGYFQQTDPSRAAGYRGCAVGCTLPKSDRCDEEGEPLPPGNFEDWHIAIEHFYGIHYAIALAIDAIFESLPAVSCGDFAVQVIEVIPVGADLSDVADWWWRTKNKNDIRAADLAADLIERLRTAPVPIPA